MSDRHRCVAIFNTRDQTAVAVAKLRRAGFDTDQLSVVGRDVWDDGHSVGQRHTGEALVYQGSHRLWWERMWSILPGRGAYWFFGDGPLLVAGGLITAFATAPEEIGDLESAIALIGIPEESAPPYVDELTNGRFLLIAQGALETVDRAHRLLSETEATNGTIHHGE